MQEADLLLQKLAAARQAQDYETVRQLTEALGSHYFSIGEYAQALGCYEQGLQQDREQGNHAGEVALLNSMALVYDELGEPQRALDLLQQALPLVRRMGDRSGEATTLNDMALVYQDMGEQQQALDLLEQALILRREDGDYVGQATTLNNIAGIYHAIGEPYRALSVYKQAYPIFQQIHHRAGEAATLNNMALVYRNVGEPQRALGLLQQTLPIRYEVGEQVEVANTLTCMASVLMDMGRYENALESFEQSLVLERETQHRAGEAAGLVGAARLLYRHLDRRDDAMRYMEQAITVLEAAQLSKDAAGHTTDMLKQVLQTMQHNEELGKLRDETESLSATQIQQIVGNTIAVMTVAQDQWAEWHTSMAGALQHAQQQGEQWAEEAAFFQAVIHVLDGQSPTLPDNHPYALAVAEMNRGIRAGRVRVVPREDEQHESSTEAASLVAMAQVYAENGQHQRALEMYQQALALCRKTNDVVGEASTLSAIAEVHHALGQAQQAITYYDEALVLYREHGRRGGEALVLDQMALLYRNIGQPHHALELYAQALPICREVGDQPNEAATLNGMAAVFMDLGRYDEALATYEQCAAIEHTLGNHAGEAAGLIGAARLLYRHLHRHDDAIATLDKAIHMLESTGLSQDAAGHTTAMLKHVAAMMRRSEDLDNIPDGEQKMSVDQIQQMVSNTITVLTMAQDKRADWYAAMQGALLETQQRGAGWQAETDFFQAILTLLDGKIPVLPDDHAYAPVLAELLQNVQASHAYDTVLPVEEVARAVEDYLRAKDIQTRRQVLEAQEMLLFRPGAAVLLEQKVNQALADGDQALATTLRELLDLLQACISDGIAYTFAKRAALQPCDAALVDELVQRTVAALRGNPEQKLAHTTYLTQLDARVRDEQIRSLVHTIQVALFGANMRELGANLTSMCRAAWERIVAGVEQELPTNDE
jgi:tetratricopeptide (TPR) repeat protein